MNVSNPNKLDFCEAAKYVLLEVEEIRKFYEDEGITLENIDGKKGEDIYDVATAGIGIVIDRNGELATGEEAFRVLSDDERGNHGDRIFSSNKGRYVVKAGKKVQQRLNKLFGALDFAEEVDVLDPYQEDIYT